MHAYVIWRAATVPALQKRYSPKTFVIGGMVLWLLMIAARAFRYQGDDVIARAVEVIGMGWLGLLFLTFVPLISVDIVTGFGWFMPRLAPALRGFALLTGVALALIAVIQGMRPPIIQKYDVHLANLPEQLEGKVIVAVADLHLKPPIDKARLAARVAQIQAQRPDFVFMLGDIFEGRRPIGEEELSILRRIEAPLGVWAVLGNHEFHGNENHGLGLTERAGWRLLRNRHVEVAPGLVLAGVDDLRMIKQSHPHRRPIAQALADRPPAATLLLSHSPQDFDQAGNAGVDLMLCGHTHGGQVWPFSYLVRNRYPLLNGRYHLGNMTVIVTRGAGTWGPRMRLWQPGEILHVTLHRKP